MHILDNYGYLDAILTIVIIGLIIDVIVHLTRQMKNSGKWKIDYKIFAEFVMGTMLLMCYFTYAFREFIVSSMLISMWLISPFYVVLRNLKKSIR